MIWSQVIGFQSVMGFSLSAPPLDIFQSWDPRLNNLKTFKNKCLYIFLIGPTGVLLPCYQIK